jgi:hypothetical protein
MRFYSIEDRLEIQAGTAGKEALRIKLDTVKRTLKNVGVRWIVSMEGPLIAAEAQQRSQTLTF